jgi:hypothetical protein
VLGNHPAKILQTKNAEGIKRRQHFFVDQILLKALLLACTGITQLPKKKITAAVATIPIKRVDLFIFIILWRCLVMLKSNQANIYRYPAFMAQG